jgi:Demerecviridae ATP-dependent protease
MSVSEHILRTTISSQWTLYDGIDSFSTYKDLISALKEAQEGDSVELRINCPGGRCDVGMMIVQAIKETRAVVVCNVVYPSHSMGAIIAVAGDYLIMQPHSFLMFHTYSGGTFGKSGDMIKDVQYTDEALKGMLDDIVKPFLTKAEISKMHRGDDIYIKANDPTLQARVKRHFKAERDQ